MYMNKLTHIIDVYIYIQISEHIIFLRCKENKYRRPILFILYIATPMIYRRRLEEVRGVQISAQGRHSGAARPPKKLREVRPDCSAPLKPPLLEIKTCSPQKDQNTLVEKWVT